MRSEHEGMSLWFEPGADGPGETVHVGTDVRITVAVEPADASHRVEVRYRVNQGAVEQVVADPVRHIGDAQYFRACLPTEGAEAEVNFLKLYAETVPPEIIDRNNKVLGDGF